MNIRNKPCACGSGRKHKKCCGDPVMLSAKRVAEHEEFMRQLRESAAQRERELLEKRKAGVPPARKMRPCSVFMALAVCGALGAAHQRHH